MAGGQTIAPLVDMFRLWCDAQGVAAIRIEQARSQWIRVDTLVVDLSPLRLASDGDLRKICAEIACDVAQITALETSGQPSQGMLFDGAHMENEPIWIIPEAALRFECIERLEARGLARALKDKLAPITETLRLVQQLPSEIK